MATQDESRKELLAELEQMLAGPAVAKETLQAICGGDVDAVVVYGKAGPRVFHLRGTDQPYRFLIEHMSDGAATLTLEGMILYGNPRLAELLATPLEKVQGQRLRDFVIPADRHIVDDILGQARDKRASVAVQLQSAEGRQVPVLLSLEIIRIDENPNLGLIVTDLTTLRQVEQAIADHERAEESLHASEERFRLLVDGVIDYAIFMLDPQGRVVSWNAGAERIKGYRADEIMGRHFSCFYSPEAVAQAKPESILESARAKGRSVDEGWRVRKDGLRFWASVVITALRDEDGTLVGFLEITRDLSDRKRLEDAVREREERFRSLVESANEAIILADEKLKVTFWNPAARTMFGYAADEALGKPVTLLMPERYKDAQLRGQQRFLETGECSILGEVVEFFGLRKDGTEFPIALSLFTWLAEGRISFGTIIRDISVRKRGEAERERLFNQVVAARQRLHYLSRCRLQAQEEERRHLAQELHDQIGQSLTWLIMSLEGMTRESESAPFHLRLQENLTVAHQLLQQVRNLSLELRPAMLDEFGLADALEWYLDRLAQKAGFKFKLSRAPEGCFLPPEVRTACFRVAQEVLTNVARHAQAKQVSVELRPSATEIELVIRDDGIGFDSRDD